MSLYEFEGKRPEIGEGTYVHPQAVLVGAVKIGRGCYIGPGAVLRADFGEIFVGNGSNVQENAVAHASPMQPVILEDDVIFAHGALIHDATVKKGAVVGMGAVILHRAVVEEESMVAAGAMVSSGFVVPRRRIVAGNPAKVVKEISDQMMEITRLGLAMYQELPGRYLKGCRLIEDQSPSQNNSLAQSHCRAGFEFLEIEHYSSGFKAAPSSILSQISYFGMTSNSFPELNVNCVGCANALAAGLLAGLLLSILIWRRNSVPGLI